MCVCVGEKQDEKKEKTYTKTFYSQKLLKSVKPLVSHMAITSKDVNFQNCKQDVCKQQNHHFSSNKCKFPSQFLSNVLNKFSLI